jgi:8-oxo-dGTP pyrophosphatase MutT (NUDIX family)
MNANTRYQAAILQDHQILLILHREHASGRSYWILPGGGREPGETEEQTVLREMKEETGLDVKVERLLLDDFLDEGGVYNRYKTYLCTPISGEARPGYEPEPQASAIYAIAEVRWFDLINETSWGEAITTDRITYPLLQRIQAAMGYRPGPTNPSKGE